MSFFLPRRHSRPTRLLVFASRSISFYFFPFFSPVIERTHVQVESRLVRDEMNPSKHQSQPLHLHGMVKALTSYGHGPVLVGYEDSMRLILKQRERESGKWIIVPVPLFSPSELVS